MRLIVKPLLLLALLFSFIASVSAQPALYVEGTHYVELAEPVRTDDPNTIEVKEIFWYGCPHCYAFEPLIGSWAGNLQSDVAFIRSPGMWNQLMEVHAQLFYTAEMLGVFEEIHTVAFNEFHQRSNYLQTEEQIKEMFVGEGVDGDEFDRIWGSFSVASSVRKAKSEMSTYGIRSVPNMVVNGKYRISITDDGAVGSHADMLSVVDFLVAKERNGS